MEMVAVTRLFCKQTELMTKRPHLVALGMTQSMLSAKVAQWMVARPKAVSNCFFGGLEFVSDSPDQGVVTTITDFVPGEDVLVLPLEIDTAGSAAIHLSLSKSFKLMTTVILIPFFQLYTLQRHQQKLQSHRQQQYVCCAPPI